MPAQNTDVPSYSATIRHLRAFLSVARNRSFTRAADELHLSQPSLTVIVQQFEDIVGASLFDRTTRSVGLTPEGEDLYSVAERVVSDFDFAIRDIRLTASRRNSWVRLAVVSSIATQVMPDLLKRLKETRPEIRVQLREGNSDEVRRLVRRNEVDIGFGSKDDTEAELAFKPVFRDRIGLLMRKNHPLTHKMRHGALRWEQLSEHNVVGLTDDTATAPFLSNIPDLVRPIGLPSYQVSTFHMLWSLVANGLAVATVPALAAKEPTDEAVVFAPLQNPEAWRTVHKITRLGRTIPPIVSTIVSDIENVIAQAASRSSLITLSIPPSEQSD